MLLFFYTYKYMGLGSGLNGLFGLISTITLPHYPNEMQAMFGRAHCTGTDVLPTTNKTACLFIISSISLLATFIGFCRDRQSSHSISRFVSSLRTSGGIPSSH